MAGVVRPYACKIDCAYHMPGSIKAPDGMLAPSTIEAALSAEDRCFSFITHIPSQNKGRSRHSSKDATEGGV